MRLFDAMVECRLSGIPWQDIYFWSADEFVDFYHAIKRIEARKTMDGLSLLSQGMHGDKKSQKGFIQHVSQWLPKQEGSASSGGGGADDLISALGRSKKGRTNNMSNSN